MMKTIKIYTKINLCSFNELSESEKNLIKEAKEASENAYAPYSGFQVGSAVLMEDNTIIRGNNQENVAYPSGLCAERVAVFYAQSLCLRKKIIALAIVAKSGKEFTSDCISPCGACRQVLIEAENRQKHPIKIYLYGTDEIMILENAHALLPLTFDSLNLKGEKN